MMKRILAADIGNTNITLGLFKGRALLKKAKIVTGAPHLYKKRLAKFLGVAAPDAAVISSVVPAALAKFKKVIATARPLSGRSRKQSQIYILGENMKAPIQNLYRARREVGQDRLVNAFAAKSLYGAPSVVIDFGTAITFDIVSKRGEYLGGVILPGIELSLAGLHEKRALLPKVELIPVPYLLGKDTAGSIRAGILFGFGAMCDGLIEKYRKIFGRGMRVVATGGNARLMKKYAKSIDTVDEDLTLKGLAMTLAFHKNF